MSPPACVLVTHDLHPYGAQRLTAALVETLAGVRRAPVELVSLGGGALAAEIRRLAPIHMTGTLWKTQCRGLEPIAEMLHRQGCRRAILNTVVAGIAAPVFSRLGFQVISLVHEMPTLIASEGLDSRLRMMHEFSDAVVYPHESVAAANHQAFADLSANAREHCIPQGLVRRNPHRNDVAGMRSRVRHDLGLRAECPVILGVGSGSHRKGFYRFLACASRINQREPRVAFIWIGPADADLLAQWKSSDGYNDTVASMVKLPGFVENTAPYHAAADLFFLASREDPFPFVALESLDAGVPIIAYRGSGGGADLAATISGAVIDDDVAADRVLLDWLGDHAGRGAAGQRARDYADANCSFETYTDRLLSLFPHADDEFRLKQRDVNSYGDPASNR